MEKTNKTKEVLKHLQTKKSITSMEAIKLYGSTRLSAIIFNLRKRGYIIDNVWMEKKDKYGNNCQFVKYIYGGRAVDEG
jgi:hypothetical protein